MTGAHGPVFIGGLSHSGKTELRMILGSHPGISMTRGIGLWDRYYRRFGDLREPANFERCLRTLLEDEAVRRLRPDESRIRREFSRAASTYAQLFGLIHRHYAQGLGKERWGEQLKSIERFADPIFRTFPSARLIHMVRDPLARFAEAASRGGKGKVRGALGWETARWLRSVSLAERNVRRYPDNYRVVRFEALAADPFAVAREVCAFVGEEYVPEMAETAASLSFDARSPHGERATGGLDAVFVDRYAKGFLQRLDYTPSQAKLSAGARFSALLLEWPVNRAAMTAWKVFGATKQRVVR